jgi:hypothetical protein
MPDMIVRGHPGTNSSWSFSFQARHHGTVPTSTADANYRRFVLDTADMPANPVKVLDSVELGNYARTRRSINWKMPFAERFIAKVVTGDTIYHEDSTDGLRLRYLADDATVYRSETEIDAQPESFARSADQYVQVVDLGAMHALRASVNDALVYPNPSSGDIRIVLPAGRTQASVVSICDAMGRIVERIDASPTQVTVDVPALESGTYTVRIETTAPTHAMPIVRRVAVVQ